MRCKTPSILNTVRVCLVLVLVLVCGAWPLTATAGPGSYYSPSYRGPAPVERRVVREERGVSLSQAIRIVQARCGDCRVLKAHTVSGRDGHYHRIQVLDERGRVRVYSINADNGDVN